MTVLTTTLSTKGQVILPRPMRDELDWGVGTRLVVEHVDGGVVLRKLSAPFAATLPDAVFGCLSYAGPAKSIEDMQAGIDAEAKRRHAGGR